MTMPDFTRQNEFTRRMDEYKNADKPYKIVLNEVLGGGEWRDTRSGRVLSLFSPVDFRYSMRDGTAPMLTGKTVPILPLVGELLWFMNGETSIKDLKFRTWGNSAADKKTIWTGDQERWGPSSIYPDGSCGRLYGAQWRDSRGEYNTNVDQLAKLVKGLKENPAGRYHILNSWNAAEIDANLMALPPCHVMFQCYVSEDGELSLKWYQRSVDCFLGLPFNIASYGLLLRMLCRMTGYSAGDLIGSFGDAHIYEAHLVAVEQYLKADVHPAPFLKLDQFETLDDLKGLTALDFKSSFVSYKSSGLIPAPLSVG